MLQDRYGNSLSTANAEARDAYVEGVDRFLGANHGAENAFMRATEADDGFALAHAALARTRQVLAKEPLAAEAMAAARARTGGVSTREAGHVAVLGHLIDGNGAAAYKAIGAHLLDHPRDAMIVQPCTGVFGLIGFSGQPGREAEQLAFTAALTPHYGDDWWFLGQHAFSQVEAGQTGPATASIERSLAGNPRNANGSHIRAHIYYEAGETEAGYAYIADWRQAYDKQAPLHCHISWHIALWALEQGDVDTTWRTFDTDIAPGAAWGPPINVVSDSAALLYRAELAGVDVPAERWRAVSDYAARFFPKPGIAFADMHAALAHAMAGNGEALEKVTADATGPAADLVKSLAEVFQAIAAGAWTEATARLTGIMASHERIGGSRAQRDLLEYALLGTLLKQGRADEARLLLATRRPVKAAAHAVKGL